MTRTRWTAGLAGAALLSSLASLAACKAAPDAAASAPAAAPAAAHVAAAPKPPARAKLAMFAPLPASMEAPGSPPAEAAVALGRMLYFDARLSKNHDVSCNSCHDLAAYGVDGKPFSVGHKGQLGGRNSPTTYNAAAHFVQFWDGRAADVEAQAKGPVTNPVEMAMPDEARVVATLRSIPGYADAFRKAFPGDADPVTFDNFARAVGAFERKLLTPARWDAYLAGDEQALTAEELAGAEAFVDAGCVACHAGAYLGGNQYQKAGAVVAWPNQKDAGRFDLTKQEPDRMMFKVPSLRNVEKTAPYFHDASAATLEDAVKRMGRHQLGKELDDGQVRSIVAFLKTLTGAIPTAYVAEPALPPSGPGTPRPDPS